MLPFQNLPFSPFFEFPAPPFSKEAVLQFEKTDF